MIDILSFRPKWRNGASGTSDMDGNAARVAARESGDEQVQSLNALGNLEMSLDLRIKLRLAGDFARHDKMRSSEDGGQNALRSDPAARFATA